MSMALWLFAVTTILKFQAPLMGGEGRQGAPRIHGATLILAFRHIIQLAAMAEMVAIVQVATVAVIQVVGAGVAGAGMVVRMVLY